MNHQDPSENIEAPILEESSDDITTRPNTSRSISSNGNNILNSSLSGSFREENEIPNDDDDDDEILDGRVRLVPNGNRKHRSAPTLMTSNQPSTSYNVPLSSPGNRIGVVAIPNSQFDPTRTGRGNNNFI